jgi:hypothetical protein
MIELIKNNRDVKKHGYSITYATMEETVLGTNKNSDTCNTEESCRMTQKIGNRDFFENIPLFSVKIQTTTFEIVIMMRENNTLIDIRYLQDLKREYVELLNKENL